MKTYLFLWINSDGATPTDITKQLNTIGFRELHGKYDYAYNWDQKPSVDDILKLGDLIQHTLKGSNVMFKMETQ